jgi:DNA-binding transcriptional MerR regulator
MAKKAREAFRTISEVANWLDVPAHVLRFWESKFAQIKPVKRAGGRRYYRPADMRLIGGIKMLLHDDGLTIRGVQKMLKEDGVKKISELSPPLDMPSEEEGAARRTARRARRKARLDERKTTASDAIPSDMSASAEDDPITAGTDAPEAPFVHVEEDNFDAQPADNVVAFHSEASSDVSTQPDGEALTAEPFEKPDEGLEDASEHAADTPDEEVLSQDTAPPEAPVVSDDPQPGSGVASTTQNRSIAVLKNLRRLEVATHLADGSETVLGGVHRRLVILRDRMSTEPPAP